MLKDNTKELNEPAVKAVEIWYFYLISLLFLSPLNTPKQEYWGCN